MPIYDYHCQDCQTVSKDVIVKAGDPQECPICRSPNVLKLWDSQKIARYSIKGDNSASVTPEKMRSREE